MTAEPRGTLAPEHRPVVLARLAALKLRGSLRKHLRRLRTPTGILFAVVAAALAASWLGSLGVGRLAARASGVDTAEPEVVRLLLLVLVALNLFAHLGQRGLFLQRAELDALLSAPVPRSAVLGHRLVCSLGRALVGSALLGAAAAFRVPTATGAFLGAACLTVALTLLGQTVSLAAAQLERRLPSGLLDWAGKVGGALVVLAFVALALGAGPSELDLDPRALLDAPLVAALAVPLEPLVRTFLAPTAPAALAAGLPVAAFLLLAFELVRRWPSDWREVAVATSGRVGLRLERARRLGTGASAARVSRWAARRRVPWVLGRSPMGAVVWRKGASIARRARVTLVFAGLTLAVGVGGLLAVARQLEDDAGWATAFLVVFGSVYLSGGLRFDLREEVDRIEELKAWPLSSTRLFAALLVPQVLVVGGFVALGAAVLSAAGAGGPAALAVALCFLPVFLVGWVATDNVFFLLWPVRVVPGADGVLQDLGRASVLFLCRGLVTAVALFLAGASAALVWYLVGEGTERTTRFALAAAPAWLVLAAWSGLSLRLGGRALARFDPSRLEA